jgi:hypothetical protein
MKTKLGVSYVTRILPLTNDFPCGFIFIEMAKIVVGSPSLTQPLLFYPGLRPAMLVLRCSSGKS